jgi:peptide chain release factor 3
MRRRSLERRDCAEPLAPAHFAIISHPDAGEPLIEVLLNGAVVTAGSVKAKAGGRSATSDWMELEQTRGISITSAAMQFDYRGHTFNLLDTPGHKDFSEDTYRVLAAVDAVVMVLDAAKGIEPQTLKLFEVCRSRNLPVITFLNKIDRPSRDPLELLDEIETQIDLRPTPATWPVGDGDDFLGVIDRRRGMFSRFTRTARGATMAPEELISFEQAAAIGASAWTRAIDGCELLDAVGADVDLESFLAGSSTPVFAGSALTDFGVRHLLDAVVELVPPPPPRPDRDGVPRPIDAGCSAFVFKVQANMDKSHRDRLAFARIRAHRTWMIMTTPAVDPLPRSTPDRLAPSGPSRPSPAMWWAVSQRLASATSRCTTGHCHLPGLLFVAPVKPAYAH